MTQTPYGLSTPEAEASRAQYGDNSLTEHQHEGFWDKYWANLNDPMIRILCVALVVSIIITIIEHNPWYEPLGIAIAVALATFVSTFSEFRNESAFKRLQDEASRVFSKVYRDGSITELPIDSLVVGDWVLLQAGDLVPSDGVLVEGTVALDQSALNGETEEAEKAVMPQDYIDEGGSLSFLDPYKLFRGSIVVSGQAVLSVTTVGDKSVYGQIAEELQADDDRDTPLKLKLKGLARGISRFGYVGGILIAVAFLFQEIVVAQGFDAAAIAAFASDWLGLLGAATNALMLAVIIIVMAVPEGLPLMIAIVSAQNMGKMLKDNVLVRKLEGIETAGSLNILFSDKTGTITKGQLQAMAFVDGAGRQYQSIDAIAEGLQRLLALSIHKNTDAVIAQEGRGNTRIIGGNATERAILGFAAEAAGSTEATVTGSIPFNSANKYSAAEVNGLPAAPGQSDKLTLVKGAPEKIIERCQYYYESHGQKAALCDPSAVLAQIDALAARAIRVIALATCADGIVQGQLPASAFTLVGIIGIRDEVRPESIGSIAEVQNAGVQVVMITGDRKDTAIAVAREAGLVKDGSDLVLTSDELAQMSDSELKSVLPQVRVIARALPSDKSRLIRLAQDLNLVTGMTGDGVNDSPALKAADVGFAMGGGTEIAKEASEVIIMDDNFSSIDKAILYGRTIFNSIRKFIVFQLT
ncbi:MAG: HAD-IC family P-type ATPase, partial [Coriobacteriia bacterium]|nr:HAD-IC family P-type ATPase [Coriobacteriia bacterium]